MAHQQHDQVSALVNCALVLQASFRCAGRLSPPKRLPPLPFDLLPCKTRARTRTRFYNTPRAAGSATVAADARLRMGKDGSLQLAGGVAAAQSAAHSAQAYGKKGGETRPYNRPEAVTAAHVTVPKLLGEIVCTVDLHYIRCPLNQSARRHTTSNCHGFNLSSAVTRRPPATLIRRHLLNVLLLTIRKQTEWTDRPTSGYSFAEADGDAGSAVNGYYKLGEMGYNPLANNLGRSTSAAQAGAINGATKGAVLNPVAGAAGPLVGTGFSGVEMTGTTNAAVDVADPRVEQTGQAIAYPFNILSPWDPATCSQVLASGAVFAGVDFGGPALPLPGAPGLGIVPFCAEFFNTRYGTTTHASLPQPLCTKDHVCSVRTAVPTLPTCPKLCIRRTCRVLDATPLFVDRYVYDDDYDYQGYYYYYYYDEYDDEVEDGGSAPYAELLDKKEEKGTKNKKLLPIPALAAETAAADEESDASGGGAVRGTSGAAVPAAGALLPRNDAIHPAYVPATEAGGIVTALRAARDTNKPTGSLRQQEGSTMLMPGGATASTTADALLQLLLQPQQLQDSVVTEVLRSRLEALLTSGTIGSGGGGGVFSSPAAAITAAGSGDGGGQRPAVRLVREASRIIADVAAGTAAQALATASRAAVLPAASPVAPSSQPSGSSLSGPTSAAGASADLNGGIGGPSPQQQSSGLLQPLSTAGPVSQTLQALATQALLLTSEAMQPLSSALLGSAVSRN